MNVLSSLYTAVTRGQTPQCPYIEPDNPGILRFCKSWISDATCSRFSYNFDCQERKIDGLFVYMSNRVSELQWYHKGILKLPFSIASRVLAVGDVMLPYFTKKVVHVALGTTLFLGAKSIANDIRNENYGRAIGKAVLLVGVVKVAHDLN